MLADRDGDDFDPDLEARLVALILGESSEFEAESLERLMVSQIAVRNRFEELSELHGLVEAAAEVARGTDEEWKLSADRRALVMDTLGIGKGNGNGSEEPNGNGNGNGEAVELRIGRASRKVLWAAAACLMINVVLFAWLISQGFMTGNKESATMVARKPSSIIPLFDRSSSMAEQGEEDAERNVYSDRNLPPASFLPAVPAPPSSVDAPAKGIQPARESVRSGKPSAAPEIAKSDSKEAPGIRSLTGLFNGDIEKDLQESSPATRKSLAPSNSMAKAIASATPSPTGVPVPELEAEPDLSFGDGSDVGEGWGSGGGGGFGKGKGRAIEELGEVPGEEAAGRGGSRLAQNEISRRADKSRMAEDLLQDGRAAYARGHYESAVKNYTEALRSEPGGFANVDRRKEMEAHLADGTVALSQQYRRTGRYDEAKKKLNGVLSIDPNNQRARQELEYLDDPIHSTPGLTYKRAGEVDKVRRHLYTAEGYKNLGLYDDAIREYQSTLRTDPDNSAARRGMENIHNLKRDHYRSSYDESRARMLAQVDDAWELATPRPGDSARSGGGGVAPEPDAPDRAAGNSVASKLDSIIIPEFDLKDASVDEAMELLRQKARDADEDEIDPAKKGVDLEVRKPRFGGPGNAEELDAEGGLGAIDPGAARIKELKLKNVPLGQALEQVAEQAGLRKVTDDYAVTLVPRRSSEGDSIGTRTWKVGPEFLRDLQMSDADEDGADPFGGEEVGSRALRARLPLVELLKETGIDFPSGASAQFIPSSGTIIVSNTPENLDLMDQLTAQVAAAAPPRAPIDRARFNELFKRDAGNDSAETAATQSIERKLKNIIVPMVDFDDATLEEAVDFIRQRSMDLDTAELDPNLRGLNFKIRRPKLGSGGADPGLDDEILDPFDPGRARVKELKLRNVPLATLLDYVCQQARMHYTIDENGITLLPLGSDEAEEILVRSWEVHPDLVEELRREELKYLENGAEPDPFGNSTEPLTEEDRARRTQEILDQPLVDVFRNAGIDFPPGASMNYLTGSNVLVVKNTTQNQDLVDQVLESVAYEMAQEKLAQDTLETSTREEPFSTFSLHVSDVSFKLAKATLEKGQWPVAGQIRVEEFVNAFDYDDPTPLMSDKVACRLEQAAHPFMQQRNLLRISMKTAAQGRAGGTPLAVTVLLDKSGSMERVDRAESVRRAFEHLTRQMKGGDVLSVITFARTPRLVVDRVAGDQAGEVARTVALSPIEGGTNLEGALQAGLEKAREQRVKGGLNRVILLTDGAANLGNSKPEDLAKLVDEMRESDIAFDACGVGAEGLNDEILESLTRKGDGRYYFLDRPEDADAGFARQIAGALRPAAKNVKVQVHFNPRRVGYYKLYGFEKHELERQDFRNDSVDAAELAAEESGNAIYQVEVKPDGEGEIGSVSVRFRDLESGRMVERRWVIPYERDAPRLGAAAPSMKLAGSAALLGEKLNGSAIGSRVQLSELVRITSSLKSDYPLEERVAELIEMTMKAREME